MAKEISISAFPYACNATDRSLTLNDSTPQNRIEQINAKQISSECPRENIAVSLSSYQSDYSRKWNKSFKTHTKETLPSHSFEKVDDFINEMQPVSPVSRSYRDMMNFQNGQYYEFSPQNGQTENCKSKLDDSTHSLNHAQFDPNFGYTKYPNYYNGNAAYLSTDSRQINMYNNDLAHHKNFPQFNIQPLANPTVYQANFVTPQIPTVFQTPVAYDDYNFQNSQGTRAQCWEPHKNTNLFPIRGSLEQTSHAMHGVVHGATGALSFPSPKEGINENRHGATTAQPVDREVEKSKYTVSTETEKLTSPQPMVEFHGDMQNLKNSVEKVVSTPSQAKLIIKNKFKIAPEPHLTSLGNKLTCKPLPLVHMNRWNGQEILSIDENAQKLLSDLGCTRVITITVCGEVLAGKSYIANLLANEGVCGPKAFPIHEKNTFIVNPYPTVDRENVKYETNDGIHFWIVQNKEKNVAYMVLDFEGFGDFTKTTKHDNTLFMLACVISSQIIYVTCGSPNEQHIKNLHTLSSQVRELKAAQPKTSTLFKDSSIIQKVSDSQSESWDPCPFIWLIRSFDIDVIDESGNPAPGKEFLNEFFGSQSSETAREHCRKICQLFKNIDCFILKSPFTDSSNDFLLPKTPYEKLPLQFRLQLEDFQKKIFDSVNHYHIDDIPFTASGFSGFLKKYVEIISNRETPDIVGLWLQLQDEECQEAQIIAEKLLSNEIRSKFMNKLPIDPCELLSGIEEVKKNCVEQFHKMAIGSRDKEIYNSYYKVFLSKVEWVRSKSLEENEKFGLIKYGKLFNNIVDESDFHEKIEKNQFENIQQLHNDLDLIKEKFVSCMKDETPGLKALQICTLNEGLETLLKRGTESIIRCITNKDEKRLIDDDGICTSDHLEKYNGLLEELQIHKLESLELKKELEQVRRQQLYQHSLHDSYDNMSPCCIEDDPGYRCNMRRYQKDAQREKVFSKLSWCRQM